MRMPGQSESSSAEVYLCSYVRWVIDHSPFGTNLPSVCRDNAADEVCLLSIITEFLEECGIVCRACRSVTHCLSDIRLRVQGVAKAGGDKPNSDKHAPGAWRTTGQSRWCLM